MDRRTGNMAVWQWTQIGATWLQAKEADNHQKPGEEHEQIHRLNTQERSDPTDILILDFQPPDL